MRSCKVSIPGLVALRLVAEGGGPKGGRFRGEAEHGRDEGWVGSLSLACLVGEGVLWTSDGIRRVSAGEGLLFRLLLDGRDVKVASLR